MGRYNVGSHLSSTPNCVVTGSTSNLEKLGSGSLGIRETVADNSCSRYVPTDWSIRRRALMRSPSSSPASGSSPAR